jgi:hypothetical protein
MVYKNSRFVTVTLLAIWCISWYRAIHLVHTRTHILWLPNFFIKNKKMTSQKEQWQFCGLDIIPVRYCLSALWFYPGKYCWQVESINCTICKDRIFASRPRSELLKLHRKEAAELGYVVALRKRRYRIQSCGTGKYEDGSGSDILSKYGSGSGSGSGSYTYIYIYEYI